MSTSTLSSTKLDFLTSGSTIASFTATSSVLTFGGSGGNPVELKNIENPTADNSAATKYYVDNIAQGITWKEAVVAATTGPITLATDVKDGDNLDGVTLATNDRILIKNQANAVENGIYIVAAFGAPARSADFAIGADASGKAVFVISGTVNNDNGYVVTSEPAVVGTDPITFTQFTGLGQVIAGPGLSKNGNELSVNVDDLSIEINLDTLQVKDGGITNAMLAGSIDNAKLSNSAVTVDTGDGLQNGGSVSLGSSVTINVDATVLRITGGQTVAGTETFSGDIVLSGTTQDTGTITLTDTIAPLTTNNKLYANGSDLYWQDTKLNQTAGTSAGTVNRLAFYSTATQIADAGGLTVSTTNTSIDTLTLYQINGTNGDFSGTLEADGNISIPTDAGSFRVGAGNDLQLTHNGTLSTITNLTGVLRIDNQASSDIQVRLGDAAGSTSFVLQSSAPGDLLSINSSGVASLAGSLTVDNIIIDGTTIGNTSDTDLLTLTSNQLVVAGNLDVTNGLDVTGAVLTTAVGITNTGGEVLLSGGNLQLNDNVNLTLGTSDDLTLVHNGTNTVITSTTGDLVIDNTGTTSATTFILGTDTSATLFEVQNNSAASLFTVDGAGEVNVKDTTDATSVSTGSFQTLGGVGIAKELHVGQNVNAVAYNSISDVRLKTDIDVINDDDVSKLDKLVPKKYKWINEEKGTNLQYGLVAQDVEQVLPEIVSKSGEYLNVNYQALIPLLLKKIQDLEARVISLEN